VIDHPAAIAAGQIHVEMVLKRQVLGFLDVLCILCRFNQTDGGQRALACQGSTMGEALLMAGPSSVSLDLRASQTA
jgi:hypothetical protein